MPAPAQAFSIFGFKFFESDEGEGIVDPLNYTVTFDSGGADGELEKTLRSSSTLLADSKRPVSGSLGLMSKVRAERELLVAALYSEAHYDGVVDIAIAGRPIDDIPLDAQFGAGPVPVAVKVQPGGKFVLGTVRLKGDAASLQPADYDLVPGGDAGSTEILAAEAKMVRALKDEGRPLAKVVSRDIVADHATMRLDVTLDVAAGPVAGYGETTVTGTQDVDREFTRYMAGLVPGRTYSPQEMDDARERLVALEVFSSVTVREADALDAGGRIPIDVEVSERKHRFFGAGVTFSSTEGAGLEGYWGHRNLFGRAERLRIEGAVSGIGDASRFGQFNFNSAILFEKPGVLGPASKFISSLRGNFEHPDAYEKLSVDARAGVRYELTRRQTVSAEGRLEWSRVTDSFSPVIPRRYLLASIPLEYTFDARDNRLNPTEGYRLVAYGEPTYDIFSGAAFMKFRGEASAYQSFDEDGSVVLAGRVAAGSILGVNTLTAVPADRRFYAGGGGSVRGYAYQGIGPKDAAGTPTGGLSYAEASAELRFQVTDTIGLVPFIDAGTVSTNSVPDFSDIRFGAGLGLRYVTPFGPLRIDAGIPLNPRPGDPVVGIYAGIGQAF